jgi:DNA-binding CsgD family transcriptional regulator
MRCNEFAPAGAKARDLALARAVLAIGQDSFSSELLASLQAVAPVDHVMIFGFAPDARAECLANADAITIAADLGDAYASHFHAFDPNKDAIFNLRQRNEPVRMRFAAPRTYPTRYRKIFFEDSGIVDKFATALWHDDRCFYVNFYRIARSGRFTSAELLQLERSSASFVATIARHFELQTSSRQIPSRQAGISLAQQLEHLFCRTHPLAALSPRERDICIKILLGFTSEAVALDLGLSHNTVLTYRRRAYERLGIGSQNELFARVFQLLATATCNGPNAIPIPRAQ